MIVVGSVRKFPASRDKFVDREQELAWLLRWAADREDDSPSTVVLTGLGGMGKTTLASVWFDEIARDRSYFKTLIWCDLYALGSAFMDDLLHEIAESTGDVSILAAADAMSLLLRAVQPFVLVLDGFERALFAHDKHRFEMPMRDSHIMRRVADPRARDLLHELIRIEGSKTLITSRLPVADLEEAGGMPIENTASFELSPLAIEAVRQLLIQSQLPSDEVNLRRLYEYSGGHPLATKFAIAAVESGGGNIVTLLKDNRAPKLSLSEIVSAGVLKLGDSERFILRILLESAEPLSFSQISERVRRILQGDIPDSRIDTWLTTLEDLQLVHWDFSENRLLVHPLVRSRLLDLLTAREFGSSL
jgi:hypothetical protein